MAWSSESTASKTGEWPGVDAWSNSDACCMGLAAVPGFGPHLNSGRGISLAKGLAEQTMQRWCIKRACTLASKESKSPVLKMSAIYRLKSRTCVKEKGGVTPNIATAVAAGPVFRTAAAPSCTLTSCTLLPASASKPSAAGKLLAAACKLGSGKLRSKLLDKLQGKHFHGLVLDAVGVLSRTGRPPA
jgi:hypothetical protein